MRQSKNKPLQNATVVYEQVHIKTQQTDTKPRTRFALCIRKGEDDDLELRKAYVVLPPASGEDGFLRVIDESGEDYLYPADHFLPLELPQSIEQAL